MLNRPSWLAALAALGTGCLAPIEGAFDPTAPVECLGDDGYFVAVGYAGSFAVHVLDPEPAPAVLDDQDEDLVLAGSLADGSYEFVIEPALWIEEGEISVVRKDDESMDGLALSLTVSRETTGRFELASLAGLVEFTAVEPDRLTGSFEAALGSHEDWFQGCFQLSLWEPDP